MSHVSTTHSPLFQNSGSEPRTGTLSLLTLPIKPCTLVDVSLSSLHGSGRPQRLPLARRAASSASSASSADAELAASSVELAASSAELAASSLGPAPRSGLPPRSARTRALLARTGPGWRGRGPARRRRARRAAWRAAWRVARLGGWVAGWMGGWGGWVGGGWVKGWTCMDSSV